MHALHSLRQRWVHCCCAAAAAPRRSTNRMRLPTPSTCRLDGVEGDLYRRHGVLFAGAASFRAYFLVCYSDASCLIEQSCLYGRVTGVLLPAWVFGHRCYAVRGAVTRATSRCAIPTKASLPALHSARNNERRRRDAGRASPAITEATAQQRRRRELAVEALRRDARRESVAVSAASRRQPRRH